MKTSHAAFTSAAVTASVVQEKNELVKQEDDGNKDVTGGWVKKMQKYPKKEIMLRYQTCEKRKEAERRKHPNLSKRQV